MPHDDFKFEPVPGLPERPPEDEVILWQGAPHPWALAREALATRWIAFYFAILALWRGVVVGGEAGALAGLQTVGWYVVLGALTILILGAMAWVMARATVYTITNKRVAMRIGAALTVTLNLPYRWIASADLRRNRDGTGSIELTIKGDSRLSYLVLWPHVRPWAMKQPRPTLRCLPDPDPVAAILAEAAEARISVLREAGILPAPQPVAAE